MITTPKDDTPILIMPTRLGRAERRRQERNMRRKGYGNHSQYQYKK